MKNLLDSARRRWLYASAAAALSALPLSSAVADAMVNSWITNSSGQYVRMYLDEAAKTNGTVVTTWNLSTLNGVSVTNSQTAPVYSGVQEIYSSSNWVYIRSSGMPASIMGPLVAYSPNPLYLPNNRKSLYRFPRTATPAATKTATGGGAIGFMVDGTQMFDIRDALSWNGTSETGGGMGTQGYWTRDANVNEGYGFDNLPAHSAPSGDYHYHENPLALRWRLGDHVDYNPVTKTYAEATKAVTEHSPILGWVMDGYPVYGPYGYSVATDPTSGPRRMRSGFALRDGTKGTADLRVTGRTNIPAWAQRIYNITTATGPSDFTNYPLARYLEDHDYLGDVVNPSTGSKYAKGVDFDLDEYNGRFCVTPEFPNGTYAYFVTIDEQGLPVFPYYIGRAFYGSPSGGSVARLSETVTTNFLGGPNLKPTLNAPSVSSGTVTLTWTGAEGGDYRVATSTDLTGWTTNSASVPVVEDLATYTEIETKPAGFYRVIENSLATYDPVTSSTGGNGGPDAGTGTGGILSVSPTSGSAGTTVKLTINLDPAANPPPANAPISSVSIGSYTGTSNVHVSQTVVTTTVILPSGAVTGPQTVTIVFPGPPGSGLTLTNTLASGFTIH